MTSGTGDCGCGASRGASEASQPGRTRAQEPPHDFQIHVEPFGPDAATLARAVTALLTHPTIKTLVPHEDRRVLAFQVDSQPVDPCCHAAVKGIPGPPSTFVATVYDYVANRVLEVSGPLTSLDGDVPGDLQVRSLGHQPLPSSEEFAEAVDIVRRQREFRERLDSGELAIFRPMPPLIASQAPDGHSERTLTVGLRGTDPEHPWHEIVGVRMFERTVLRNLEGIAQAGQRVCEPPPGTDPGPITGTAGQCWITITSGGHTVWRFLAVRPAGSSGTNGSGVELRYVDYRGKRVLYQAHVPILNVEYGADGRNLGCGPTYRDWQNAETRFEAQGTAVAPGFLLCTQPARTIIDTNSDNGNFAGVAIYVDGPEVVLVSEMQAGWYRYITEWRFHVNGTLRPRFGFAGTENRCTCHLHIHHVYWRLDFDLRTANHNTVEEFNDPPIIANNHWHTKQFEIQRPRDPQHKRKWRVRNTMSGEAYEIVPGQHDGIATSFGIGDLWVLRYHAGEIDDGQGFTTIANLSSAHLSKFMTPAEAVVDTDVVVWYAAHYVHDAGLEVGNWVGPDLVPTSW